MTGKLSPENIQQQLENLRPRYKNKNSWGLFSFNNNQQTLEAIDALLNVMKNYPVEKQAYVWSNPDHLKDEEDKKILAVFNNENLYKGPLLQLMSDYQKTLSQINMRENFKNTLDSLSPKSKI